MPKKSTMGRTVVLSSLRAGLAAASTLSPQLAGAGAARLFLSTRRHPVAERDRAQLASARRSQLESDWGPLAVWTWGPEDAPAIALQHGWEGRASQLGAFVPALQATEFLCRRLAPSCGRWAPEGGRLALRSGRSPRWNGQ